MGNYAENNRRVDRQTEYRQRKRMQKLQRNIFLLMLSMILVLYGMRLRELGTHLAEVQTALKRVEALQQKMTGDGYGIGDGGFFVGDQAGEYRTDGWQAGGQQIGGWQAGEQQAGVGQTAEQISRIQSVSLDRPIKRTREEAVQRLEELGQSNPVIAKISQNNSLYPENMLTALANNPEMAEFAAGYLERHKRAAGGLTEEEKKQNFPLFLQWDSRWGYASYGADSNIGLSGCGPTCMAMVLYYLTRDETWTPDRTAAYAMENGYYVEGTGTAWALMQDMPELYNIRVSEPELSENAFQNALSKGRILICAMGAGDFTAAGHFIVIYGYDQDGFMVNDPNCVARSRKRWAFDEIRTQIKMVWSYDLCADEKRFEEKQTITFVDFAG